MKRIIAFCTVILAMTASCEDLLTDPGTDGDVISSLEDTWHVEEVSQAFGNHPYVVEIMRHASDSARIYVDNFYNVDATIEAVVSGHNLSIPQQQIEGGYTVTGSGTVSPDLKKINWQYGVDDGSGQVDECTAVYTRF